MRFTIEREHHLTLRTGQSGLTCGSRLPHFWQRMRDQCWDVDVVTEVVYGHLVLMRVR